MKMPKLLPFFAIVVLASLAEQSLAADVAPANGFDLRNGYVMGAWTMLWAGQALQLAQLLSKLEGVPNAPSFAWWLWIKSHPWTMLKQVIAAQACYTLLAAMPGQLTVSAAFGVGYMANDWATRAATKTETERGSK